MRPREQRYGPYLCIGMLAKRRPFSRTTSAAPANAAEPTASEGSHRRHRRTSFMSDSISEGAGAIRSVRCGRPCAKLRVRERRATARNGRFADAAGSLGLLQMHFTAGHRSSDSDDSRGIALPDAAAFSSDLAIERAVRRRASPSNGLRAYLGERRCRSLRHTRDRWTRMEPSSATSTSTTVTSASNTRLQRDARPRRTGTAFPNLPLSRHVSHLERSRVDGVRLA